MLKIIGDSRTSGKLASSGGDSISPLLWLRAGPRRVATIGFAFVSGSCCGLASSSPLVALPFLLCFVVAAVFPGVRARLCAIVFCAVLAGYVHALVRCPARTTTDVCQFAGQSKTLIAEIESIRPAANNARILTVSVLRVEGDTTGPVTGRILVWCKYSPPFELAPGKSVRLHARLLAPHVAKFPYQFDSAAALARKGIFTECRVSGRDLSELVPCQDRFAGRALSIADTLVSRWRSRIVGFHQRVLGPAQGSLLSSMVLGDRAVLLADGDKQIFRDAGLSHVLAASGYNLTMVLMITGVFARLLVRSRATICCLSLGSIVIFVLLAGVSPSIWRAAVMCVFVVIARYNYRTLHMPAVLSCTLTLAVLCDPVALTDIGLQLSYVATAAMIFGARAFPLSKRGWREKAVELTGATLLAQSSVFPLQLLYFYETSVYFLPANLLACLLVPLVCSFGFCSSLLVLLQPLLPVLDAPARWITQLNSVPLFILSVLVRYIAGLPGAVIALGPPAPAAVLLFYLSLLGLFVFGGRWKFVRIAVALMVLSFVLLSWRPPLERELQLSIGRRTTLIIHTDRSATCCTGSSSSSAARRALAYYAVNKITAEK